MSDMWNNAVNEMIQAINSDINIKNFFINFEPNRDTGYVWSQNNNYLHYARILDNKTSSTGHSGASFACCLREAVNIIKNNNIIIAENIDDLDENIIILDPIE
tara:strand:+ start:737 stop:1045 length:309 start_codon:yes stop_codon:yes gene_type:complete